MASVINNDLASNSAPPAPKVDIDRTPIKERPITAASPQDNPESSSSQENPHPSSSQDNTSSTTKENPNSGSAQDEQSTNVTSPPTSPISPQGRKLDANAARFYSGRNRVPRIESYWELYPEHGLTGQQSPPITPDSHEGARQRSIAEHSEEVTDPVTGKTVRIVDAKFDSPKEIPKTGKETFPPVQWTWFLEELRTLTIKLIVAIVTIFVILNGFFALNYSFSIFLAFAAGVTWWRRLDSAWQNFVHYSESERGKQRMKIPGAPGNESVEWLNGTISKLWPQVNADIFNSAVDLLEDVMQNSIPSIITQVKIVNIGQGSTPLRILSMRWLADENEASKPADVGVPDRVGDLEEVGEWANLEVSFAYRGEPTSASAASKAKNANLLVNFYMGVSGLFGTPIPVWVELRGATGTCRLKVQMIPDPPFIKLVTFTLMGMPKIEIAAVPMNQRFFNVMNLPVVSDFINSSIKAAARQFVAPSNFTLDLAKILVGEDTKKELLAVGVLVVNIHSAIGVKASDLDGKSDCYVTLSYSKSGKPLWSTRIIFNELNPIWDETAMLLLGADEVKAAEKLSVQLWDSDRFTADDVLGRTEMDVTQLLRSPGKKWEREDNLMGVDEGRTMPGKVKWSVAYYGKRELDTGRATEGNDERLPKDLEHLDRPASIRDSNTETENRITTTPPDPSFQAGIISIQVHNIVGLERHIVAGSKGSALRRGLSQLTEEEDEGQNLPSSYCSIVLDSHKIYRTRVKPMTSKPFFNAGTERFVRDWTKCKILVVVRDSRLREEDPILGVVELTLKDVLVNRSQISRFYPIRGGIGYGKIRISLLFRSIDTQLPKSLLGADVGSVEIVTRNISGKDITDPEVQKADCITFSTPLINKKAVKMPDGGWSPVHNTHGSTGFRLGVRHRHSESCVLYFRRDSKIKLRSKTFAVAILWLKDIPDDEEVALELPVYRPSELRRFILNCGSVEQRQQTQAGTVHIVVRFHRGLGHSHRRAAKSEKDFHDVIEATKCIGNIRGERSGRNAPLSDTDDSDATLTSGSDSDDEAERAAEVADPLDEEGKIAGMKRRWTDKRRERQELHRMERGAMQWKGARTLAWVGKGVRDKGRAIGGLVKMEPRRPGVETEV